MFAFKFTLRCLQPDIVPIICHRSLPPASLKPVAICHRRRWHRRQFDASIVDTMSTAQGELVAKFAAGVVDTG
jgi:hypothetical protein